MGVLLLKMVVNLSSQDNFLSLAFLYLFLYLILYSWGGVAGEVGGGGVTTISDVKTLFLGLPLPLLGGVAGEVGGGGVKITSESSVLSNTLDKIGFLGFFFFFF